MKNKFSGFYSALKYTSIDILMKPRLISDVLKSQFYFGNKQFVSFKKDKNSATPQQRLLVETPSRNQHHAKISGHKYCVCENGNMNFSNCRLIPSW